MAVLQKLVAASAGALIVFHTLLASALDATAWVRGTKVGEIKGHAQRDASGITVLEFSHGPTKPGDLKAALAAGKRVREPITLLVKLDGPSADQWRSALKQQDKLQLKIAFYRPAAAMLTLPPATAQQPYYTLTLGDATLEKVEAVAPDKVQDPGSKTGVEYLQVSFTFQKIEWTWVDGGKTASDDWTQ